MTIFVDASALIAIIAGEADTDELSNILAPHDARYISAIAVWETIAGLRRSHTMPVLEGRALVDRYLYKGRIIIVPIDRGVVDLALDAYVRYGKGRHPAALNMGDCFAYACAKALGAHLLYKGGDFAKTDLAMKDLA